MKKALIVGAAGQDGYYLTQLLSRKGYAVYGVDKCVVAFDVSQRRRLVDCLAIDLTHSGQLADYVKEICPDEIYYLAAHHFSSQGSGNRMGRMGPFLTVNLLVPNEVLECLQYNMPACRFFYASSAHIFGVPDDSPQTEETVHRPNTPYAISKSAAVQLCRYYRETHGVYAVAGILYNHESVRRGDSFVTTQIAKAAAKASAGNSEPLILRNLDAVVDWGAAEDYVRAMWLVLQQKEGNEYIISSNQPRTVMDFCREAFFSVGLDATDYVCQESGAICDKIPPYVGDNSKLRELCGWTSETTFQKLVADMVVFQIKKIKNNGVDC